MTPKVSTLLTLDAFGTLFTPREPIAKLYGDTARKYGLTGFSNDDVGASFRKGKPDHVEVAIVMQVRSR